MADERGATVLLFDVCLTFANFLEFPTRVFQQDCRVQAALQVIHNLLGPLNDTMLFIQRIHRDEMIQCTEAFVYNGSF